MTKTGRRLAVFIKALLCLALAGAVVLPFYFVLLFEGCYWIHPIVAVFVFILSAAVLFLVRSFKTTKAVSILGIVCAVWLLLVFICGRAEDSFRENQRYLSPPDTKAEVFSGKKVMLLVPHQDDEINLLGGVIEEYVRYGSELTVVYSTNGDYYGNADIRLEEAVEVLSLLGVGEENIVFLGYGDEWQGGHIYNSSPNEQKTSRAGRGETYGSERFSPYRDGQAYTNENFRKDIKSVILEYRPEVIYCVDYDYNRDHRALSLMFEKVMGEILRQEADYRPVVMKGFAYSTAWYAAPDYEQQTNLASTVNIYDTEYMPENNIYLWQDRVRLPVCAASLSRTLETGRLYEALFLHRSQNAVDNASCIINSDKVFWQRETGSVLYDAAISVGSGRGELLNDFMLTESGNIEADVLPFEGTWRPDMDDRAPCIHVELPESQDISRLSFYDDPDLGRNILDLKVRLDDGTELMSGPLAKNGSATMLEFDKRSVKSMEIFVEEYEGERPGLTEIEAYSLPYVPPFELIKLTNQQGDFVYDCLCQEEELCLSLWSSLADKPAMEEMELELVGDGSAKIEDGQLKLYLDEGEKCEVTITHAASGLSDSVIARRCATEKENPLGCHIFERRQAMLDWQREKLGMIMNENLPGGLLYLACIYPYLSA